MQHGDNDNYAVVKFNQKTNNSETLMVVRGRSAGGSWAIKCAGRLTEDERADGWTFYTEKTDLPVNDSTG
jgi:hypothetical protein